MATATTEATTITPRVLDYLVLRDLFHGRMNKAVDLELKGATIKNRLYEARALELAILMKLVAATEDELAEAEDLREQAEARAFNHKTVKDERAIRRAEFKAANPAATEQE
jgi:TfoX/Sxy family transcriptional regulator of competence genes